MVNPKGVEITTDLQCLKLYESVVTKTLVAAFLLYLLCVTALDTLAWQSAIRGPGNWKGYFLKYLTFFYNLWSGRLRKIHNRWENINYTYECLCTLESWFLLNSADLQVSGPTEYSRVLGQGYLNEHLPLSSRCHTTEISRLAPRQLLVQSHSFYQTGSYWQYIPTRSTSICWNYFALGFLIF